LRPVLRTRFNAAGSNKSFGAIAQENRRKLWRSSGHSSLKLMQRRKQPDVNPPTTDPMVSVDSDDLAGASILLVDDNPQNLELMLAYLDGLPWELRTARDGLEAVAQIERRQPDVVLLDVMMPRMSGFEVCQKIKSSPRTRDVVVIMVTALHEVGDYERAHES